MEIRSAASHKELHACVELMIQVWNLDPKDAVPFNQLHAAHAWGGQVLVAVDGGRVVGFSYGFGGRQFGRPVLLSHMLAVLPEYRGQGTGQQLKLAQARWARESGYGLITWTFDPLEAVNAHLNIGRLGAIARTYLVNHYGEMADGLNRGLPSDRLLVEWYLDSPHTRQALAGRAPDEPSRARECVVPPSFQSVKANSPDEALAWRFRLREALQTAFAAGYVATGFRKGGQEAAYLLIPATEVEYAY